MTPPGENATDGCDGRFRPAFLVCALTRDARLAEEGLIPREETRVIAVEAGSQDELWRDDEESGASGPAFAIGCITLAFSPDEACALVGLAMEQKDFEVLEIVLLEAREARIRDDYLPHPRDELRRRPHMVGPLPEIWTVEDYGSQRRQLLALMRQAYVRDEDDDEGDAEGENQDKDPDAGADADADADAES
jgi:hypothetical protein